jgi:predicted hydrolase (HD superfamily)
MINRNEAIVILKKYLRNEDNIKYSLAVEAVIIEIAKRLERNENIWGLTGLLHKLDFEYTLNEPEKRGTISAQILEGLIPNHAINAIKANNYIHTDYIPTTSLDKTLISVDAGIGLILEIVNKTSSKKITDITLENVIEKFQNPNFTTNYNKNKIQLCMDVGIELRYFFKLILNTLNQKSEKLNL